MSESMTHHLNILFSFAGCHPHKIQYQVLKDSLHSCRHSFLNTLFFGNETNLQILPGFCFQHHRSRKRFLFWYDFFLSHLPQVPDHKMSPVKDMRAFHINMKQISFHQNHPRCMKSLAHISRSAWTSFLRKKDPFHLTLQFFQKHGIYCHILFL